MARPSWTVLLLLYIGEFILAGEYTNVQNVAKALSGTVTHYQWIHTAEKRYKCKGCDKAFISCSQLTRHQRIHTAERSYSLYECGQAFTWRSALTAHYQIHTAAAVADGKLLHSCLALCNPVDGSPPGSPIPEILQTRTLEWVAISFSSAWKWKVKVKSLMSDS